MLKLMEIDETAPVLAFLISKLADKKVCCFSASAVAISFLNNRVDFLFDFVPSLDI